MIVKYQATRYDLVVSTTPPTPRKHFARAIVLGCAAVVLIGLGFALGSALTRGVNISWRGNYEIGYADFIGIVLSALSVLLTVLAIFLAIFGVIGWASFSERLRESTYLFLGRQLQEGEALYNLIRKEVRDAVYEGVQPVSKVAPSDPEPETPFEPEE